MSSGNQLDKVTHRFNDKSAVIGVVGLGYVGLPLMLRYVDVGYKVVGFDVDQTKIDKLNDGQSYIERYTPEIIQQANAKGFEATSDFSRIAEVDAIIICVPTPLGKHKDPDLSYITNTADAFTPYLKAGQVVSLESTTYPGTTDEELQPRINSVGLAVGDDVYLVYSPEREDPANPDFETRTIPKVVGGVTPACLEVGLALYGQVIDELVPVSSARAAEMTKLLENIHRAVNIGLVNEMKVVAHKMDIDIYEVIRAAATKPFGFVPYYPGPGLGGHCIPIDPYYLTWKAKEYGINTRFIELAGEVNDSMPQYVIDKTTEALNRHQKSISGSNILVLGIAYKKNVDDQRESPSVELIQLLKNLGAIVNYSDPHIKSFPKMRKYDFSLTSVELTPDSLASFDCVIVATNHDRFDYDLIEAHAKLIVDTRGVYSGSKSVVKA